LIGWLVWVAVTVGGAIYTAARRLAAAARHPLGLDTMKGVVVAIALIGTLATFGAWLWTHIDPASFGICHTVAMYQGNATSVQDCDPFSTADFTVPLLISIIPLLLLLFLLGERDFVLGLPWGLGNVRIGRETREGVAVTREKETDPEMDRLADGYLTGLPGPPS
jgi:hypothetical protein